MHRIFCVFVSFEIGKSCTQLYKFEVIPLCKVCFPWSAVISEQAH